MGELSENKKRKIYLVGCSVYIGCNYECDNHSVTIKVRIVVKMETAIGTVIERNRKETVIEIAVCHKCHPSCRTVTRMISLFPSRSSWIDIVFLFQKFQY